ncbi:polysaccharide biosynthesis tyrosine autokinase [Streptomyces gilvus]|uniref:polysaccharide biosynthesis tyrosine autokinase n=1 Tax=Streptomyces gilvus TaxID=2920937 RepID=UPI001F0DE1F9|nr:polysaccharide biosynthesis tyrosine autokinase [Streptomyces sp. CME 23]MCH5671510.1 polysaccharide biosynthesis tyrosine autokinase [Streptomyces sp. CME 23]
MDLPDYLRILARRWRAVVVLALLGTATGVLAALLATPQYRATSTLFVSLQDWGDNSVTLNQGNSFAQARVRSYAEVVVSPRVTEPVVRSLHLSMTPAQLAGKISTEVPLDTVLLKITVSDPGPARAARISNAVAGRFAQVIASIERPVKAPVSPVRLSVTQPAATPSRPYSPNFSMDVALGLAGGLVLGGCWAFARESLDASVRSGGDLAQCLVQAEGPSVLGCVTYDSDASACPIAANHDPFGPRAEDFRRVRTGLQFVDIDNPPKIIAVTSALPGEGKTSISVNLAAALAEAGSSVCLVDADLRRPNVARTLHLVQDAGLTTVMIGKATPEQVMQSGGSFSVLASGALPPNPAEMLGSEQFRAVVRSLADKFDHVVVDTAPLLPVADTPAMAPAVDGYLLVVRHGKTNRAQIVEAIQSLQRVGALALGGILNMTPVKGDTGHYAYSYRPVGAPRRWGRFFGRRQAGAIGGLPAPSKPVPTRRERAVSTVGTPGGDASDTRHSV